MGKFSTLENCRLTKTWTLKERAALASYLERQNLAQGENLFYEQSQEQKLYLLDSGLLKIQCGSITVEFERGASLGELSLLSQTQKQISAVALKDCFFWVITDKRWKKIREEQPALAYKLIESINKKFADLLNDSVPPPKISSFSPSTSTGPQPGLI